MEVSVLEQAALIRGKLWTEFEHAGDGLAYPCACERAEPESASLAVQLAHGAIA